jgi:hypothetical protein
MACLGGSEAGCRGPPGGAVAVETLMIEAWHAVWFLAGMCRKHIVCLGQG